MLKISSLEIVLRIRSIARRSLAAHKISYGELCHYGHTTPRSAGADGEIPSMNKFISLQYPKPKDLEMDQHVLLWAQ